MRQTHTLKEAVESFLKNWEAQHQQREGPHAALQKVLSKKELDHIRVRYFTRGVLGISVDSSAWLYNLNLRKDILLEKLRSQSESVIKDIRFSLGDS